MTIAITDPGRDRSAYDRYASWVERWLPGTGIRRIGYLEEGPGLDGCAGLILSGGGDVHPRLYGRLDALELTNEVNERRDEFELGVIEQALREAMPVLGICRGMQIFNVAQGGSLIPDIEREGLSSHKKTPSGDRVHSVALGDGTLLERVVQVPAGEVNSSHHQAVRDPGKGLKISATAGDGVPEGLEWETPAGHSSLLLVQWHPERMKVTDSPFARNIALRFREEVHRFSKGQ